MTPSPNGPQTLPVSTTTRPVTQIALVAVNRASSGRAASPLSVAIGRLRSAVPTTTALT